MMKVQEGPPARGRRSPEVLWIRLVMVGFVVVLFVGTVTGWLSPGARLAILLMQGPFVVLLAVREVRRDSRRGP